MHWFQVWEQQGIERQLREAGGDLIDICTPVVHAKLEEELLLCQVQRHSHHTGSHLHPPSIHSLTFVRYCLAHARVVDQSCAALSTSGMQVQCVVHKYVQKLGHYHIMLQMRAGKKLDDAMPIVLSVELHVAWLDHLSRLGVVGP